MIDSRFRLTSSLTLRKTTDNGQQTTDNGLLGGSWLFLRLQDYESTRPQEERLPAVCFVRLRTTDNRQRSGAVAV
jgi:hypothetical protein